MPALGSAARPPAHSARGARRWLAAPRSPRTPPPPRRSRPSGVRRSPVTGPKAPSAGAGGRELGTSQLPAPLHRSPWAAAGRAHGPARGLGSSARPPALPLPQAKAAATPSTCPVPARAGSVAEPPAAGSLPPRLVPRPAHSPGPLRSAGTSAQQRGNLLQPEPEHPRSHCRIVYFVFFAARRHELDSARSCADVSALAERGARHIRHAVSKVTYPQCGLLKLSLCVNAQRTPGS